VALLMCNLKNTRHSAACLISYRGIPAFCFSEGEPVNGSKTAVMDGTGFLCVSLGSSTAQHHDSLGSRCVCTCSEAGFSSQNGSRA
jgi:hypothetical protein